MKTNMNNFFLSFINEYISENDVEGGLIGFGPVDGYIFEFDYESKTKLGSINLCSLNFDKSNVYIERDIGIKCNVILYTVEFVNDVPYYGDIEAYSTNIIDPVGFIMNQIRSGYFGVVAKACDQSEELIKELLENYISEEEEE